MDTPEAIDEHESVVESFQQLRERAAELSDKLDEARRDLRVVTAQSEEWRRAHDRIQAVYHVEQQARQRLASENGILHAKLRAAEEQPKELPNADHEIERARLAAELAEAQETHALQAREIDALQRVIIVQAMRLTDYEVEEQAHRGAEQLRLARAGKAKDFAP